MSKKRNKKYNPKKVIQQNAWMTEDYIVFAVDAIAMGVRHKKTGKLVGVGDKAYNALQHGMCGRNAYCGLLYKDPDGKQQIEIEILVLSRCTGQDAMTVINERTDAMCHRVGIQHVMGRFYFITGDLDYEWDDNIIYQWLDEAKAFDRLATKEELLTQTLKGLEEHMKNYDPKKVQIGGEHYIRLAVQPLDIITWGRLNWYMANALKYVARHEFKNRQQDLSKAYDYITRALYDGLQEFYQPKAKVGFDHKVAQFVSQFNNTAQQKIIRDICTVARRRYSGNEERWTEDLVALQYNINELCKVEYGTRAY